MIDLLDDLQHDPELEKLKRRKRHLMAMAFVFAAALFLGVGYLLFSRSSELCTGADKQLAGIWNEEKQKIIELSFAKTDLSYSVDTFIRVEKRFEDYLSKWKSEYVETCEATRIRGEQSEEIMDLRMECLIKHLRNARALTKVFAAADKVVVENAIQAVSSLSGFSNCDDVEALREKIQPPKDQQTKSRVAVIRDKLAKVEALSMTGKYQQGLNLVQNLNQQAKQFDYRPVQAEVLYWLGSLLERVGQYKEAERCLHDAARSAGHSRGALVAAKAMIRLVHVVGYQQARYEVGLSIARYAEVVLGLSEGDDINRAELVDNLGIVYAKQGEYDKALQQFGNALSIYQKKYGPEHSKVANSLNSLGVVLGKQGKYQKALEYYQKALVIFENTLGPEHPLVAQLMCNKATLLHRDGENEKSLIHFEKALVIQEKALGTGHPVVAQTLNNMGLVFQEQARLEKALGYYLKAMTIWRTALGSEHPYVGFSLCNIGAVFSSQKNFDMALRNLRKSVEILDKTMGSDHPLLANPLGNIGGVLIDQNKPQKALAPLERAVSICAKRTCELAAHGQGLFVLAQALVNTNGDKLRAIRLTQQALKIFEKIPKASRKEREEIDAWLTVQSKTISK